MFFRQPVATSVEIHPGLEIITGRAPQCQEIFLGQSTRVRNSSTLQHFRPLKDSLDSTAIQFFIGFCVCCIPESLVNIFYDF